MTTLRVFWKDKFGGRSVTINAADFNPALHRLEADGGWGRAAVRESQPVEAAESPLPEPDTIKPKPSRKPAK